jgi:spermidine synthase
MGCACVAERVELTARVKGRRQKIIEGLSASWPLLSFTLPPSPFPPPLLDFRARIVSTDGRRVSCPGKKRREMMRRGVTTTVAAVLALTCGVVLAGRPGGKNPKTVVLFDKESKYRRIQVVANIDGYVSLHFDRVRGRQSVVKLADPGHLELAYTRTAFAALAFKKGSVKDVLIVGLGGGSMPMFLRKHYPDATIDIVELDPMVVEVAKEFFEFKEDAKMKVTTLDGRGYLRGLIDKRGRYARQYDFIFLDAYDAASVPFHLTTTEFLKVVRGALKPDGCVVSNIWSRAHNVYYDAMVATYWRSFPALYVLKAEQSGNHIFIASTKKEQVTARAALARAAAIDARRKFRYDLAALLKANYSYVTPTRPKGKVLLDDYAPVNVLKGNTQ